MYLSDLGSNSMISIRRHGSSMVANGIRGLDSLGRGGDGRVFLDCRINSYARDRVCCGCWLRFVFTVVDMIAEEILILQEEIKLLKSALAAARRACLAKGIATREFAKMCNVKASVVSAMTGEIPDRVPDLVESKCI